MEDIHGSWGTWLTYTFDENTIKVWQQFILNNRHPWSVNSLTVSARFAIILSVADSQTSSNSSASNMELPSMIMRSPKIEFGHYLRQNVDNIINVKRAQIYKSMLQKACKFGLTVVDNCQFAQSWTFSITLSGSNDNTSFWKANTSNIFNFWSQHLTQNWQKNPKFKIPQNNINLPWVQYIMMQRNQKWMIIVNCLPPFPGAAAIFYCTWCKDGWLLRSEQCGIFST